MEKKKKGLLLAEAPCRASAARRLVAMQKKSVSGPAHVVSAVQATPHDMHVAKAVTGVAGGDSSKSNSGQLFFTRGQKVHMQDLA